MTAVPAPRGDPSRGTERQDVGAYGIVLAIPLSGVALGYRLVDELRREGAWWRFGWSCRRIATDGVDGGLGAFSSKLLLGSRCTKTMRDLVSE